MTQTAMKTFPCLTALLRLALLLSLLPAVTTPQAARADATNKTLQMALGNPDGATDKAGNTTRFLIRRPQLALSYNDKLRFPNWVAWHLSRKDIGSVERGQFKPDSSLPARFTRITPTDYTRSGYDRGHNCPSKDRSATRASNDAVFQMTNITPQAHGMNAGPWEKLESYCRDLTGQRNELFIYCGHGFSSKKARKTISSDRIAVPDFGWKIVVVVPPGRGDAVRRITPKTRVIAVRMPNISTVSNQDWREYRTSVEDIEKATGLKFFGALPGHIAPALKNRVDFDMSAPSRLRTNAPAPNAGKRPGATPLPPGASLRAKVWVNTRSGVYWRPGTEFYGKTKRGKYMSETEAIKAGHRAAGGQ